MGSPPPPPPPPLGWSGKDAILLSYLIYVALLLDPNRKPPPPLNSPTKPSPKQKQPPAPLFNPSDVLNRAALKKTKAGVNRMPPTEAVPPPPPPPSEPEWAPREYLEKGEHYLE